MKKQKLFLILGLVLLVLVLVGYGIMSRKKSDSQSASKINQTPVSAPAKDFQAALPATVSTQPGANVDAEVNNITKDLNAANADDFNSTGLSDKNLGL